jgi:AcrR family transcriptional regulator
MDAPGSRRKRLSADARREIIVDAAREVFVAKGFAGARLRDIAGRAGITEAYLYRYFTSKTELYHAAIHGPVEASIEELDAKLDDLVATPGMTGADLIRRLNVIMLEFMVDTISYLGVAVFSDVGVEESFYTTTIYPRVHLRTREILGALRGWPDRAVDLEILNNSMWSLNYGIALDGLLRGTEVDIPRVSKRASQLYLLGIPQFKGPSQTA